MSLIPSESYSFPDNYSPVAARRSRTLKDRDAAQRPVNRLQNMVLPEPIRLEENIAPFPPPPAQTEPSPQPSQSDAERFFQAFGKIAEQAPPIEPDENVVPIQVPATLETNPLSPDAPNGQEMFLRALGLIVDPPAAEPTSPPPMETAEPPRIPLAPRKVRPVAPPPPAAADVSLSTANGHGRPRNLRPKTPVHALQHLVVAPPEAAPTDPPDMEEFPTPTPAPVLEAPIEQFDFEEDAAAPFLRQRRRKKLARFFLYEFMAIAVLVPSAAVVLSRDLSNPTLVMLMNVLTISAAVAAAVIPIFVFAIGPAFTRDRRM